MIRRRGWIDVGRHGSTAALHPRERRLAIEARQGETAWASGRIAKTVPPRAAARTRVLAPRSRGGPIHHLARGAARWDGRTAELGEERAHAGRHC